MINYTIRTLIKQAALLVAVFAASVAATLIFRHMDLTIAPALNWIVTVVVGTVYLIIGSRMARTFKWGRALGEI